MRLKKTGFTLVETLCVIGIIISLCAFLMPSLVSAKRAAYSTTALSNVRSTGEAVLIYCGDFDDTFPYGVDDQTKSFPWLYGRYAVLIPTLPLFSDLVLPYAKSRNIFLHPLDLGLHRSENGGMTYVRQPSLFAAVGSSFLYNVDLGNPSATAYGDASDLALLQTAAGFWQCGCAEMPDGVGTPSQIPDHGQGFKYAVCMGDGRGEVVSYGFFNGHLVEIEDLKAT